ncbi:MAG: HIRAN domain-containing protein [Hydrogenophilales bacterium]|nr:HIRAN domain-containing protein [Hydrogenophilales bacterium]
MIRIGALLAVGLIAAPVAADTESHILIQTSPLAGFQYHAGRALFPLMSVGDRLTLVREADNPYDPKAVRVEWRGVMIGFAPRVDNTDLARMMDHGVTVEGRIVHLQKARDPWKRVLIEVLVPEASP